MDSEHFCWDKESVEKKLIPLMYFMRGGIDLYYEQGNMEMCYKSAKLLQVLNWYAQEIIEGNIEQATKYWHEYNLHVLIHELKVSLNEVDTITASMGCGLSNY